MSLFARHLQQHRLAHEGKQEFDALKLDRAGSLLQKGAAEAVFQAQIGREGVMPPGQLLLAGEVFNV